MEDQLFIELVTGGQWLGMSAMLIYAVGRGVSASVAHVCELAPQVLSVADKALEKGITVRIKMHHYTEVPATEDIPVVNRTTSP